MSLVTPIHDIISDLYPKASFILSSKFKAAVIAHQIPEYNLPLIVLNNELSKPSEIKKNNNVQKNNRIIISFLDLDSVENNDEQTNAIVEAMESMADRVAAKIYQRLDVRLISGNQAFTTRPIFHYWSTNMSGTELEMNANENIIVKF